MGKLLKNIKAKREEKRSQRQANKQAKKDAKLAKKDAKTQKILAKANKKNAAAEVKQAKAKAIADGTWQGGGSKIADIANNAIGAVKGIFVGEDVVSPSGGEGGVEMEEKSALAKYGVIGLIIIGVGVLIGFIFKKK